MIKIIDTVHNDILLDNEISKIIETVEFKRLKNIKQMGCCIYKYPSATNTRYEHCIGVAHLAGLLLDYLERNTDGLKISRFHKKCVVIAGLLHDIGHGPFSHFWEYFLEKFGVNFKHEENFTAIAVKSVLENCNIFQDKTHDAVLLIVALIQGNTSVLGNLLKHEEMFLGEIINNEFSEMDVDKWDYIIRDAFYLNKDGCDIDITNVGSFFQSAKVVKGMNTDPSYHIAYSKDTIDDIERIFEVRLKLHDRCYQNIDIKAIEAHLRDVLVNASQRNFKIKETCIFYAHFNPDAFLSMDDTIIDQIELDKTYKGDSVTENFFLQNYYKVIKSPMLDTCSKDKLKQIIKKLELKFGEEIFDFFIVYDFKSPKELILFDLHNQLEKYKTKERKLEKFYLYSKRGDDEFLADVYDFISYCF